MQKSGDGSFFFFWTLNIEISQSRRSDRKMGADKGLSLALGGASHSILSHLWRITMILWEMSKTRLCMSSKKEASKRPLDPIDNSSDFISPKCLNSCLWTSHRVSVRVMKFLSLPNLFLATSANSCSLVALNLQTRVRKPSNMPTCPSRQISDFT